jgi:hypothetical protein
VLDAGADFIVRTGWNSLRTPTLRVGVIGASGSIHSK